MITWVNKSKTLTKHISCKCKGKFDGRKGNSNQWWNKDKYRCECQKYHICGKDYIRNPDACSWENRKYFASIIDDSVTTCDEIIDLEFKSNNKKAKAIPKNKICEKKNFCVLLAFLVITIALFTVVSS